ncbi:MAG TPA: SpoIIE family protein phosphatase, partial [Candidatus Acidoferrum sp.]
FEVDDLLIAYTDGITETENDHGEPWGQQRLENLLRSYSRKTPEQIVKGILDQVSMFANGQPQQDDMTLVVIGVQGGCDDYGRNSKSSDEIVPWSRSSASRK